MSSSYALSMGKGRNLTRPVEQPVEQKVPSLRELATNASIKGILAHSLSHLEIKDQILYLVKEGPALKARKISLREIQPKVNRTDEKMLLLKLVLFSGSRWVIF